MLHLLWFPVDSAPASHSCPQARMTLRLIRLRLTKFWPYAFPSRILLFSMPRLQGLKSRAVYAIGRGGNVRSCERFRSCSSVIQVLTVLTMSRVSCSIDLSLSEVSKGPRSLPSRRFMILIAGFIFWFPNSLLTSERKNTSARINRLITRCSELRVVAGVVSSGVG